MAGLNKLTLIPTIRNYSFCCPPRGGGCKKVPGSGKRIEPPADCIQGPIPPNPCVPKFHPQNDSWKKYKLIVFVVCFPLIFAQAFLVLGHAPPHKDQANCRDYEYMRRFSKRFPWHNGETETLFHNDHVNFKPGECEPPPLDCDCE